MTGFIENPNLPKSEVESIICGKMNDEVLRFFLNRKIKPIQIEKNNNIDKAIAYHADISAFHLGENNIIVDKSQSSLIKKIRAIDMNVFESGEEIFGKYPNDIKLNFAAVGKNIFGRISAMDKVLLENVQNFNLVNVSQGYAKCSVCVVSENAIITDDVSIDSAAKNHGIDSLLISKGDVVLDGHEYGFIGGASGKISENEVLFFGDLNAHRNGEKMISFVEKHNCKAISIRTFPLTDFGGIIPLTEYK